MVVCTVVIQMLVIPLVVSSRRAHVTNFLNDTVLPVVENICSHYRLRSKAISRSVLSVCLSFMDNLPAFFISNGSFAMQTFSWMRCI